MTTIPSHIVMADDEHNRDVRFEPFPNAVTTQYLSKEGAPLGNPMHMEFYTLASYLLWAITTAHSLKMGSDEYSQFSYFAAVMPINKPLELETEYVRRVYTFGA